MSSVVYTLPGYIRLDAGGGQIPGSLLGADGDFSSPALLNQVWYLFHVSLNCWVKHKHTQETLVVQCFSNRKRGRKRTSGTRKESGEGGGKKHYLRRLQPHFLILLGSVMSS